MSNQYIIVCNNFPGGGGGAKEEQAKWGVEIPSEFLYRPVVETTYSMSKEGMKRLSCQ